MNRAKYIGNELDLFANAKVWKNYWGKIVSDFINNDVLEVGSGNGSNTILLWNLNKSKITSWLCIEPDSDLLSQLENKLENNPDSININMYNGFIDEIDPKLKFDTILYIDVLEHIEDDQSEINKASTRLKRFGKLIILAPAYQFLYSEFDKCIGHYRRYNTSSLRKLTPANCRISLCRYLDSIGMIASIMNRFILKASQPSKLNIYIWDSVLVRASKVFDFLLKGKVGKSILMVWERN